MTRIARRDGLHEAPRTTFAHQLDTALDSRSGVDPCERPALHTSPDPPNDPGLDPGVDVAPSPERGGHHLCRRVAEMRRRPESTCSIFKSDRADPGPSTKTTRSPDSKSMGGCGAAEINRRTDVAHDLHRRGLARNRPRGCPTDSSNSGPSDRSSIGVLFGQSATSQKAHHVPYPPRRTLAPPPAGTPLRQ